MTKTKFTVLAILFVLVLSSCSKEKRIERSLHTRGGEWTVVSFKEEEIENGVVKFSETASNIGTIDFAKKWVSHLDTDHRRFDGQFCWNMDEQ